MENTNGNDREKSSTKITIIVALIIELLLLPVWYVGVALSVPSLGYSLNFMWVIVGPLFVYPLLVLIGLMSAVSFYNSGKYRSSTVAIVSPPVVSFGWTYLMRVVIGTVLR